MKLKLIIYIVIVFNLFFSCKKYDENILLFTKPEVALYGFWESSNIIMNNKNIQTQGKVKLKFPMEKNYGEYYGYFKIEDNNLNSINIANSFKYYSTNEIPYSLWKKINIGTDTSYLFQNNILAKNLYYHLNQNFNPKIIFLNSSRLKLKFNDSYSNLYIIELKKIKSLWVD
jgi:hypothetical protein